MGQVIFACISINFQLTLVATQNITWHKRSISKLLKTAPAPKPFFSVSGTLPNGTFHYESLLLLLEKPQRRPVMNFRDNLKVLAFQFLIRVVPRIIPFTTLCLTQTNVKILKEIGNLSSPQMLMLVRWGMPGHV